MAIEFLDILGVFVSLAGFILGLGAVTVIDLHGFFAQKSSYWTVATTRTHKITKPLIWIGPFARFQSCRLRIYPLLTVLLP